MKTTVIFDTDVATQLADLRRERNISLRHAINTAMREWLSAVTGAERAKTGANAVASKTGKKFVIPVVRGGKWLLPEGLACAQDILDWAEAGAETPGAVHAC